MVPTNHPGTPGVTHMAGIDGIGQAFAQIQNAVAQLGAGTGTNQNGGIVPPQQQQQAQGSADIFESAGKKIGEGLGRVLGEAFKALAGGGGAAQPQPAQGAPAQQPAQ